MFFFLSLSFFTANCFILINFSPLSFLFLIVNFLITFARNLNPSTKQEIAVLWQNNSNVFIYFYHSRKEEAGLSVSLVISILGYLFKYSLIKFRLIKSDFIKNLGLNLFIGFKVYHQAEKNCAPSHLCFFLLPVFPRKVFPNVFLYIHSTYFFQVLAALCCTFDSVWHHQL